MFFGLFSVVAREYTFQRFSERERRFEEVPGRQSSLVFSLAPAVFPPTFVSPSHILRPLRKTQNCYCVSVAAPRASKLSCQSNFPSPLENLPVLWKKAEKWEEAQVSDVNVHENL